MLLHKLPAICLPNILYNLVEELFHVMTSYSNNTYIKSTGIKVAIETKLRTILLNTALNLNLETKQRISKLIYVA